MIWNFYAFLGNFKLYIMGPKFFLYSQKYEFTSTDIKSTDIKF